MPTFSLHSKYIFFRVLLLTVLSSNTIIAQNSFRVFPYLQNPAVDAITILWFSEDNSPGLLSYYQKGSETKGIITSIPESAKALAYSDWENTTYFGGLAPLVPYRHRIRIENLKPSTTYEYTVIQGSNIFSSSFHTAPLGNSSVRFIVYGDPETEPESTNSFTNWIDPVNNNSRPYLIDQTLGYKNNLDVIKRSQPDLVFIAGDLVETGGEQRDWDEFWLHNTNQESEHSIAGEIPLMTALGNHEYYEGPYLDQYNQPGSERAVKRYLTYFELPVNNSPDADQEGRYYSFKYGPATFIILDVCNNGQNKSGDDTNFYLLGENDPGGGNAPDFGPGSRQYKWLETNLAEAQIRSIFTFVIFHHTPYSSGPHGYPPGETENTDNQSGVPVRQLTALFMQYGVDAVFSGHDEIWERSEISGIEIKPDQNEETHTIQFYDVGTGGDGLREPDEGLANPYQKFLVHKDVPEVWQNNILISGGKHYGHLAVDIKPEDINTWKATLKPVYVFPIYDPVRSAYSNFERRIYDDEITLTYHHKNPDNLSFSRCFPNPFKTETTIEYYLQSPCNVTIRIFDMQGKVLRTLRNNNSDTGYNATKWDSKDENGNTLKPGVYFYRIETNAGQMESKQMIFLK
jgi:3',5'-cyclic AMP phosphodiesterase CpdA